MDTYTDNDGNKRSNLSLIASEFLTTQTCLKVARLDRSANLFLRELRRHFSPS